MLGPDAGVTAFARAVWLILRKDLTIEVRSREIAYTSLFFAVSCVLVFAFALVKDGVPPEDGAAAVLWIAIMFAGNLALGTRVRAGTPVRDAARAAAGACGRVRPCTWESSQASWPC